MTGNIKTTLSSACRCGYPEVVTWDDFAGKRVKAVPYSRMSIETDEASGSGKLAA